MRIVVTGATGNVGSVLARQLGEDPAVDSVLGLARRLPDLGFDKVEWTAADITADDLTGLFRGADAVVHLAWLFQPTRRPQVTWDNNVVGSTRVLEAVEQAEVSQLVVASSVGAYSPVRPRGRDETPVEESWPTHGWSAAAYSREKAYLERLLDTFEARHPDTRVVRLRPAFIFRESSATQQRRLFAGPLVPGSLARQPFVPVVPQPRGLRFQALHTEDAATAYRLATLSDARGAFNIAAEPVVRMADIAELLDARTVEVPAMATRALVDAAWRAHLAPASPQLFDLAMRVPVMSTRRAQEELGWAPTTSSVKAIEAFLSGLQRGAGAPTPPLATETGGTARSREFRTGVGSTP